MKKTNKILALVLVLMMVLPMFSIFASAAAGQTWTVAGSSALCGSNWSTTDTKNDMTYDAATDSYVKVYYNVKAGNYEFKCAKDHAWGTAYPGSNYNLKVEKDGSTVTITLKGTSVSVKVEAPTCDHAYEVTAATVTCLTAGSRTWTCSKCQDSYTENLEALGHHYDAAGKCERCDETTTLVRVYVDNAAKWADVYCYTWDTNPYVAWPGEKMQLDEESGLYYYDIPKIFVNVIFNNGSGTQSSDLKTPTGTATIYNNSTKTWKAPHVHAYSDPTCTEAGKCSCGLTQGDALGHEFVKGLCTRCEAVDPDYVPHVNALVVGETNKIVIDDSLDNGYGYYVTAVVFNAEESAHYAFVAEGLTIWLYDLNNTLLSMTGAANLEAGYYTVFIASNTPGTTGEYNVAVTKAAWDNTLVLGENKVLITDAQDNGYGYYIAWAPFVVTEKDNYVFGGEGLACVVFDATYQQVTTTELEVGTYLICVAFATPATAGVATVTVEKTTPPAVVEDPALALGDNTVVIDGTTTNYIGNAVAWLTFTPETAGTYTFASEELTAYIYAEKNMGGTALGTGVADLEAGVTYYVLVGKGGVTGEFTVNVSAGGVVVAPNAIVVGDNHYVITDALLAVGFEFIEFTVEEAGTYVITGGAPMKVYVFTTPNTDLGTAGAGAFGWNVDAMEESGFATSFEVVLPEAGTYWFGANYDLVTEEREFDINVALKLADEQPEGGEEGGEDVVDPQPQPEMTLIQKIIAWLMDLINKLLAMFKK